jgi:hypothetical protein
MKKIYLLLSFCFFASLVQAQTVPSIPTDNLGDTSKIKVYPNPTQGEVQVQIRNWDMKSRYTINVLSSGGKRMSIKIAQGPVETVFLNIGDRKKATFFIEVWKDKTILGKQMVEVIK